MEYKVLYRKYRPSSFESVVGQESIINTLKRAIVKKEISHAYIFSGMRGTGKTTIAKIFAKSINCLDNVNGSPCEECLNCKMFNSTSDIIEMDAASNNGVDEIREIVSNSRLVPNNYKYKVYIIDEVHMLSIGAFNALLKTLEEPLDHVVFILATTDVQKVPITILSRCQRFDFNAIETNSLVTHLKKISDLEGINIDDDSLEEIVSISEGAVRDALSLLDKISKSETSITIDVVEKNTNIVSNKKIEKLILLIEEGKNTDISNTIEEMAKSNFDINILIKKMIKILSQKQKQTFAEVATRLLKSLNNKYYEIISSYNHYLALELIIQDILLENVNSGNKIIEGHIESTSESVELKPTFEKPELPNTSAEVGKTSDDKDDNTTDVDYANLEQIYSIRLNNCFVEANKEELTADKKNWNNILMNIEQNDLSIYSLLSESVVVLSSPKIIVVALPTTSTLTLVSNKYDKVCQLCMDTMPKKLSFITEHDWQQNKKAYINNLKKGQKYEIIKEPKLVINKSKTLAHLVAQDIFGEDNVELD